MHITAKETAARLGVHECTLWRWRKTRDDFPKPKKLGPNTVRFKASEIDAWLADQDTA